MVENEALINKQFDFHDDILKKIKHQAKRSRLIIYIQRIYYIEMKAPTKEMLAMSKGEKWYRAKRSYTMKLSLKLRTNTSDLEEPYGKQGIEGETILWADISDGRFSVTTTMGSLNAIVEGFQLIYPMWIRVKKWWRGIYQKMVYKVRTDFLTEREKEIALLYFIRELSLSLPKGLKGDVLSDSLLWLNEKGLHLTPVIESYED